MHLLVRILTNLYKKYFCSILWKMLSALALFFLLNAKHCVQFASLQCPFMRPHLQGFILCGYTILPVPDATVQTSSTESAHSPELAMLAELQ